MTYQKVLAAYPSTRPCLGLTATPCRADGRGLGGIFDFIIEAPQVPDLIEQGYLADALRAGRSRSPRRENPSR